MGVLKEVGFAGEGVVNRVLEVGHLREAADGDVMLLDVVPDRLDVRLLRTVPRQVDQLDIGRSQEGLGGDDGLAGMHRVVIQRDHQGPRPLPRGRGVYGTFIPALAQALVANRAAIQILDPNALQEKIAWLLRDREAASRLVANAQGILARHSGATARTAGLLMELKSYH